MKKVILALAVGVSVFALTGTVHASAEIDTIVRNYTALVHKDYSSAYEDALALQSAIDGFLASPTNETLEAAKTAWLNARKSYGPTEAFRFYEGPIDFVDEKGNEGPEARLNAWPLDESYIDYVQGNPDAGLVNNSGLEITKASLGEKNQADDEAEIATGYHAIEFLLWGQDLSLDGPGNRPVSDYAKKPENERRRAYLAVVTELLVDDLKFLKDEWAQDQDNFAAKFVKDDKALSKIMTALATLSGFELASERMGTALDSGDQEDEQSCFSDNTHNDFIYNQQGIMNVFFGAGIYDLLKAKSPELAEDLEGQLLKSKELLASLPHPIDREILSTPKNSAARAQMEIAVLSLQKQADLFKEAGNALNLDVQILQ